MPSAHQMWLNNYQFPGEEPGEEPGWEEFLSPEEMSRIRMEEGDRFVGPMLPGKMPTQGPPSWEEILTTEEMNKIRARDPVPAQPQGGTVVPGLEPQSVIGGLKEAQPVAEPGKHPFLLDMENRERKRRTLEGYRNISEGLSRAGAALATTPGGILTGNLPKAYKDEGIRKQQARFEDEVPAGMLDAYNRMYFPDSYDPDTQELIPGKPSFPEGTTMSQVKGMSGMVTEQGRQSRHQDRMLNSIANRELREAKFGHEKDMAGRLSTKEADLMAGYQQTAGLFDRVENAFKQTWNTGPVAGRAHRFASALGLENPKLRALDATLIDLLGQFLKIQTGAQRGMTEVKLLARALPGMLDKPESFMSLLNEARARMQILRNSDWRGMVELSGRSPARIRKFFGRKRPELGEATYSQGLSESLGVSSDTGQGEGGAADGDRPTEALEDGEVYVLKDGDWFAIQRQEAEKFSDDFVEIYDPNQAETAKPQFQW